MRINDLELFLEKILDRKGLGLIICSYESSPLNYFDTNIHKVTLELVLYSKDLEKIDKLIKDFLENIKEN